MSRVFAVWLKIALHKKDANMLPMIKKFFAYCFETAYNERPEDELVMLFDMTNTGISNLVNMKDSLYFYPYWHLVNVQDLLNQLQVYKHVCLTKHFVEQKLHSIGAENVQWRGFSSQSFILWNYQSLIYYYSIW